MTGRQAAGSLDNGAATGLTTVHRRSLTAQQTLVGTAGFAGAWTVALPAGTSAADLQQAEQQFASARVTSITAAAMLSTDAMALRAATAEAQATRLKEASDCVGANAAVAASDSADAGASTGGSSACQSSMQTADASQATLASARSKVVADRAQFEAAQTALNGARRSLDAAQAASTTYGGSASFTSLPSLGAVVVRGRALYTINGQDTILLYGRTPAWRSFSAGMTPGQDVDELNENLRALGFGAIAGDQFTSGTQRAIEAIQQAHGIPATGAFPLGSVVFEPGAVRVTNVTPTVGQSVAAGPIMTLSSTRHSVSVQLNAAEQSQVRVGDRVLITLPDNSTTPGVVDFVGKVATTTSADQSAGGGGASTPYLPMSVRFLRPAAAGTLDQAPVNVLVTTASVRNALVVPVNALVALAGGGYAIEVVASSGTHQLVAVSPGLFDDDEGLVQIKGAGVRAGQRVVVPSS